MYGNAGPAALGPAGNYSELSESRIVSASGVGGTGCPTIRGLPRPV